MQLETKNLVLSDYHSSDWHDIHEYTKDPDFSKYDFWGPNTKNFMQRSIDQVLVKPRYKFDFAVVDKKTLKVIGGAILTGTRLQTIRLKINLFT